MGEGDGKGDGEGEKGGGGWGDGGWEGGDTFGCVGGLVLAPVSEDFVCTFASSIRSWLRYAVVD